VISELSCKYESGGDPSSVSQDSNDAGGWSYGIVQFSSAYGVVQKFVEWLQNQPAPYNEYGEQLAAAGDPRCDPTFADTWARIGTDDAIGFRNLQDEYAKTMYFYPGADHLLANYYFDISQHAEALKQVLFSNCVQHGSYYGVEVY